MSSVSRNIVMLVSDGTMDGAKAACAADLGTRVVHPDSRLHLREDAGMPLEWWAGVLGGIGLCLIVWWLADRRRR